MLCYANVIITNSSHSNGAILGVAIFWYIVYILGRVKCYLLPTIGREVGGGLYIQIHSDIFVMPSLLRGVPVLMEKSCSCVQNCLV